MFQLHNKRPDEKVIGILRMHPFFMIKGIFWLTIMLIGIISAGFLLSFGAINTLHFMIILFFGIGIMAITIFYYLHIWNNDYYILTSYRIIDIDQNDFFRKTVTETDLANIQEISYKIHGALGSILNFGDVIVQTAGPSSDIILEIVPNPVFVKNQIVQARQEYLQRKGISENSETINPEKPNPNNQNFKQF